MTKIMLPDPPRRAELISFGLAGNISLALLMGILLWALSLWPWFWLGVLLALGSALFGIRRPGSLSRPYGFWNRMAACYARRAGVLLMAICYFAVFAAVRLAGSRILLAPPVNGQSMWVPRRTLAPAEYGSQYDCASKEARAENWISTFLSWAKRSGNLWACCLLPFFVLLSYLETGEERSVSGSIYTLY